MSEESYVTWNPPVERKLQLVDGQEEVEPLHRPSEYNTAPTKPFFSNHAKFRDKTQISTPLNGGHTGLVRYDGHHTTPIRGGGLHTTPVRDNGYPTKPKITQHPHKSPLKATAPSYCTCLCMHHPSQA